VTDPQSECVSLSSGELTASVSSLGAQLFTLRDRAGRDLLWNGDPSIWSGRAPLLFPIVGALAGGSYRLGSTTYRLPRHGFARGRHFGIVDKTSTTAVFSLKSDAESLRIYPFRFELEVCFAVNGPALSVTTTVRNAGDAEMPASFGYHPGFRWPLPFEQPRSNHFIEFASEEAAPIRRLDPDGLLTAERHPTPVSQRRLALADALFQQDAVIFDEIRSRCVTYGADVGPRIRVSYPDAPYLGLWTKPGANFICIEPWHGIADPAGFSGDFTTKPGVFAVAAGASFPMKMIITLETSS
jgi:galactose mutarotase-like enzyme